MAYLPQPWASTPRTWTSWRSCHGTLVRPSSVVGSFSDIWLLEVSGEGRWWGAVGFQKFPKTLCQLGLQIMDSMTHPSLCQKELWTPVTAETRACLRQDWIQASDSITGMFWLCLSSVLVDATLALMRRLLSYYSLSSMIKVSSLFSLAHIGLPAYLLANHCG